MPRVGERYSPQKAQSFTPFEDWLSRLPSDLLCWKEKAIFARLKRFGAGSGEIFPSPEHLSRELGIEERTVQRALASLEEKGFVKRERNKNAPSRFFLIQHACMPDTEPDIPFSETTDLAIANFGNRQNLCSQTTDLSFASLGSEETILRDKEPTPLPPSIPNTDTEDLNLEDPIETFARNLYNQKRRLRLKFTTGEGKKLAERLQRAEERAGPEEFRRGLIAYLEENSDWAFTNKWPLAGFLKRVESNGEYSRARTAAPIRSVPAPRMADSHAPPAIPPAAPNGVPKGEFGLPVPVETWNRIVQHGHSIPFWKSTNGLNSALEEAWRDKDFRENYVAIFEKVEAMHVARGPDVEWATLSWVLKPENWFTKLLQGELEYMTRPKSAEARKDRKSESRSAAERVQAQLQKELEESRRGKNT